MKLPMRSNWLILVLLLSEVPHAAAQPAVQSSQTARQALIEMLTGGPQTLEKHLPEAARKTLLRGGLDSPVLRQFSNFSVGLSANREHMQVFEEGSILLSINEDSSKKVEVVIERDDLQGDANDIELSFHSYQDGVVEPLPVLPSLTFSMKQEKEVWKLATITLTVRVPFDDPDYLKGLEETQNKAFESAAVSNLRTLNTAEISYAASFPNLGFTCKLPQLGGLGSEPSAQHSLLIDSSLASGAKDGYSFAIHGCDARPASRYQAIAVPSEPESGMRAFCSDESGIVRYAADGKSATCLSQGVPFQSGPLQ